MTGSGSRLVSLVLLLVGGLGALIATAQPWWRLAGTSTDAPVDASITGSSASAGLTQVVPACVLVAVLLTLVLRSTVGRRIVAVLGALLGAGCAVLGGGHPRPDDGTIRQVLRQTSLADQATVSPTAWPWVYLGAGVVVLAGAVLIFTSAPSWPRRADRYAVGPAAQAAAARAAADPDTWWKAMDAGVDPTSTRPADGQGSVPAAESTDVSDPTDPISDRASPSATMDGQHDEHDEQDDRHTGSGSDR